MASVTHLQTIIPKNTFTQPVAASKLVGECNSRLHFSNASFSLTSSSSLPTRSWNQKNDRRSSNVVAAVGDVSADSTVYLVGGALGVALIGTAFPIFFSRKDICPECDGAGFVRQSAAPLRANAARKDQTQIVCARCNGLGKLNQIDK